MSIFKSKTASIRWTIEPCFIITLHKRDLELLNRINNFFSVGIVSEVGIKGAQYRVRSRSDLNVIITHFNKYPLQTTKILNYIYFCEILNFINKRVHTNISGFLKLVSLINRLNKPISESLLSKLSQLGSIPYIEFEISPSIINTENLNPFWISGFVTGEGSFTYFTKTRINSIGETVKDYSLIFEVSQRTQDLHILNLINIYFKIGNVYTDTKGISRYRLRI
jgi:LAGLIDADG endonuclease